MGARMKSTVQWLAEVKRQHQIESDYALAKLLGVTRQAVSGLVNGHSAMDTYTAAKVAELVNVDPMKVIASAEAERARNDEKRTFWRKLAACVVLGTAAAGGAPTPAEATTSHNRIDSGLNIHYPPKRTRRRERAAAAVSGIARTASVIVALIAPQPVLR